MNFLRMNRMTFSPAIWAAIAPEGVGAPYSNENENRLISQAEYRTGSINSRDAGELRAIVEYFQPSVIAEVGTYIGRSTRAMAAGNLSRGEDSLTIYTCDVSNRIDIGTVCGAKVVLYPKTKSTQMFEELHAGHTHVDMFYIDGRLSNKDAELMSKLNPQALIVLDDFEGIEKGVANAAMLLSDQFRRHFLVYPRAGGKTALMISPQQLQLTPQ